MSRRSSLSLLGRLVNLTTWLFLAGPSVSLLCPGLNHDLIEVQAVICDCWEYRYSPLLVWLALSIAVPTANLVQTTRIARS